MLGDSKLIEQTLCGCVCYDYLTTGFQSRGIRYSENTNRWLSAVSCSRNNSYETQFELYLIWEKVCHLGQLSQILGSYLPCC